MKHSLKDIQIAFSKVPETDVSNPFIDAADFGRVLAENVEHLTTDNGDGTFTHELVRVDPEWPNVIE